jgi:3-hydroxyisobutyrate dehydrogenase-like beta-hydroxyacid dehydrogenase
VVGRDEHEGHVIGRQADQEIHMARRKKGTVGIIGLGIMGGAFAENLHAAGWRVIGYDVDGSRRRALARKGIVIAADAGDVAQQAPTIILSLPKPAALASTVATIVDAKVPRRVVIEASTFTLEDKAAAEAALRKAGHVLLDCPVSGTGFQARVKDLVIYASGGSAELKKLRPLFADFSRDLHDLGAFGNGSKMKFIANLLVAIHNVASAEALVLGMKAGLPPELIYEKIRAGAGNSEIFRLRAPMMVKGRYDKPTMKVAIWQKDMEVIGDFARTLGAPTPLFSATLPIYAAAMSTGYAMQDTASTCAVLEAMAGVKRGKGKARRGRKRAS